MGVHAKSPSGDVGHAHPDAGSPCEGEQQQGRRRRERRRQAVAPTHLGVEEGIGLEGEEQRGQESYPGAEETCPEEGQSHEAPQTREQRRQSNGQLRRTQERGEGKDEQEVGGLGEPLVEGRDDPRRALPDRHHRADLVVKQGALPGGCDAEPEGEDQNRDQGSEGRIRSGAPRLPRRRILIRRRSRREEGRLRNDRRQGRGSRSTPPAAGHGAPCCTLAAGPGEQAGEIHPFRGPGWRGSTCGHVSDPTFWGPSC